MKTTGGLLLLLLCAVSLAGCIHATGPCYGVGCHAFTTPSGGHSQNAGSQAAPARSAQAAATQPKSSAAKKSHGIHALLKKVKL